ncbi:GNAT family N-acetyltransferase [Chitinimonas koreensis]|uniref:GNAT family N-acetyltransferase n=1 Tax=Chitinimonas koreensis TaxID=356302 RepID=UPI0004183E13|nr:GNAT family N-acetyltransferase [Chitinimonas koreensis]QNM96447.1 GNAT family N-acetyltransferase [Chitinimonas koreensis]
MTALPDGIEALCALGEAEGFRFLRRLVDDWRCGDNRFDQDGEAFYAVWLDGRLAGVGGLNRDCDDASLARVRRVYVHPEARSHGVGHALIAAIEAAAAGRFRRLVLYTNAVPAMHFYEGLGYRRIIGHPQRSHEKTLPRA